MPRGRGRPSAPARSAMDVYDVDLLQYYWRGGTFFERFAMRREEGNTLKIAWRILARDLWAKDLWAWLAVGILSQWRPWDPWEDLYRDTVQEIQARATAH